MWNYFIFIFKKSLKTPFIYISFFLPIIFLLGLGWMIPLPIILSFVITLGILVIGMLVFGGGILEIRKTTFTKSLSVTKLSKKGLFFSHFYLALFYSLLLLVIFVGITFFLETTIDYFAEDFSAWADQPVVYWINISIDSIKDIDFFTFMYALVLSILLSFSLGFFITTITKSSVNLYLFTFVYILSFTFLSWIVIPGFFGYGQVQETSWYIIIVDLRYLIPHYWVTSLMSGSLGSNVNLAEGIYNSILVFRPDLLEENSEAIMRFLTFIDELEVTNPNDWDWDALRNDLEYLKEWIANGWIDYGESGILSEIIRDWINGEYIYDWQFYLDLFNFLSISLENIANNIDNFESDFFSNGLLLLLLQGFPNMTINLIPILEGLFSSESEEWIKFLTQQTNLWDWTDLYSMSLSFVPLIISLFLIIFGVKYFKWSIR